VKQREFVAAQPRDEVVAAGNLDEANQETVIRLLRELHEEGHTILMVTHDPSIGELADRRIDLAHGHLAQITEFSAEQEIKFDHLLEQVRSACLAQVHC